MAKGSGEVMSNGAMSNGSRRQMVVSPGWMQGAILTFVFAFSIMGYLTISLAGLILWPWQPGTGLLLIAFFAGFASLVREGRRRWNSSLASEAE